MQGAHDVRFGASVAAGELQQWQSSKSVFMGIGQDFDRVVIRAPPHGFLGSRPTLSVDAVQAVSDAVREHHGVWLETPHEGPIEAVIFDMRDEDGGQSLAALRVLAQEHGLVLETASSTYSRQFMWSRMASRLHAVGAHDGAPEEWWSTLRDVSAMEMASETLRATSSKWVPDFAELRLYAWFIKASVTNGGPPTLSGSAWVQVNERQLSKRLGLRGAADQQRVLGSPIAQMHALGAALGDGASQAIDDVVPNMVAAVGNSLCGWNLIGQLRVAVRVCEFCPLTDELLYMKTAALPSLDEDLTGVGLPYTLPRTLMEMQAFVGRCGVVGGALVPLPFASHIASYVPVQRYGHALAGLREEEREELERQIREVAEREQQRATWRFDAIAAGVFLSHSTFKIYAMSRLEYNSGGEAGPIGVLGKQTVA